MTTGDSKPIRIVIVGTGRMGRAHALAYSRSRDFEIVGVVNRGPERRAALSKELGGLAEFSDLPNALEQLRPDAVCIATYPDTHVSHALAALESGAHVFVEKPMAKDVVGAQKVIDLAREVHRVVLVGYILRVHPGWKEFVLAGRGLGKPLVMRFSLNQQSDGDVWRTHQKLLESASSVVDSGVHYVDVMCQLTRARPVRVAAMGVRLRPDVPLGQFDYGQLQVTFDDGSVGWFEAGWGPAMSREAEFVRDVIGPRGSVSMRSSPSDDLELTLHASALDDSGHLRHDDETISLGSAELDLGALCELQRDVFLNAVRSTIDVTENQRAALDCLRIVLAADEAMRTGKVVELGV